GSRCPTSGCAMARSTRGCTLEGPGPSSRRRGRVRGIYGFYPPARDRAACHLLEMSDAPENTQRALRDRLAYEREERERLAPWAVASEASRGRVHAEAQHRHRTAFQRDRDRIVHSRAFRRLEYKTQVFVYHEGDHLRNRLTHTIEASQI